MTDQLLPTALTADLLARHRVLYVDDDAVNRMIAEEVLSPTFNTVIVGDARAAMKVMDELQVSVLLADHRMPGMTGIDLCAWSRDAHPGAQRLLLTAYTDPSVTLDAINRGAVSRFLVKPCPNDALVTAVSEAVARAELERALRELQVSLQRSERAAARAGVFALFLHDLANVTTGLNCSLALLTRWAEATPEVPADVRGDLETCMEAVRVLQALHLRARTLKEERPTKPAAQLLAQAIQSSVHLVRGRALGRVKFEVSCDQALEVLADPVDLSRVLVNLLSNAVQALTEAGRTDGRVRLEVNTDGGAAHIAVQDNGPGIPVAVQPGIFERGWTSRSSQGGTGLGLAITRELATANGGTVDLVSSGDDGTTFLVQLPLVGREG